MIALAVLWTDWRNSATDLVRMNCINRIGYREKAAIMSGNFNDHNLNAATCCQEESVRE